MMHISAFSRIAHAARYIRSGLHYTAIQLKGVKGLELRMPALSPTMSEGTILKWLKKEGDPVNPGDALCEIQTDKAVMTFDTEEEGILAKILLPDDSKDVKIGTLIAMLVEEGQDWKDVEIPSSTVSSDPTQSSTGTLPTQKTASGHPTLKQDSNITMKLTIGPATKKLLQEYGLQQSAIAASGPRGTLLKGDVLKYVDGKKLKPVPAAKSHPIVRQSEAVASASHVLPKKTTTTTTTKITATGEEQVFVDLPNSEWRRTSAAGAVRSKTTIPHSYCSVDCEVDDVMKLCRTLGEDGSGVSICLNDFVIKAAAFALQRVPEVNAQRTADGRVRILTNVDVAIDVHTPNSDQGSRTILIRDAIALGVNEISDLTEKAIKGLPSQSTLTHVPLTVSNLGLFGVTEFVEIVREHQTAVLAVGTSRVTFDDDGSPRTRLTATLSYDARVFDEAIAAMFLRELASAIGNPSIMLVSLGPHESAAYAFTQS